MRQSGEHAYGYTVQLWRQGDSLFGLFQASEGLAGDTPAGILEEVTFDPPAGRLTFRAKLTIGVVYRGPGREEPSRDLFEFRGRLEKAALAGALARSDLLAPERPPQTEQVRLRRATSDLLPRPASYAEWKKFAAEILKRRGPRW